MLTKTIISLSFVLLYLYEFCECKYIVKKNTSEKFSLSVVHFNDFHARFKPTDVRGNPCKKENECIGGYSRLYSKIKEIKKQNKESVVLNAGDVAYGSFWYTVGGWNISKEFMNKLPIDAEVFGNHEFDKSVDEAAVYVKHLNHPVVAANIDDRLELSLSGTYTKSHVIQRAGKKIGIIGVVASNFDILANTGKLKLLPESLSVNKEAERLGQEEGVFTNIVLSHSGYEVDKDIAANASEKISLIVGGHSHTLLYNKDVLPIPEEKFGPYPTIIKSKYGNNVAVVQASAYCRILGKITIILNDNGELDNYFGEPIVLDRNVTEDEEINKELYRWEKYIEEQALTVVGTTDIYLDNSNCLTEECTLGNAITDAMLESYVAKLNSQNRLDKDIIAVYHQGGLRASILKGNILLKDLTTAIPFQNTIDLGQMKGKHIKEMFEYAVLPPNETLHQHPHFLQISGTRIVFNLTNPEGSRVKSIKILAQDSLCKEYRDLELDRIYYVVVTSFIRNGGEGYGTIFNKHLKNVKPGLVDIDFLREYLKTHPFTKKSANRIIIYK